MKTSGAKSAFTLIELLVVICVVAILVAMLLPAKTGGGPSRGIMCLNNQKQIAIGLIIFQSDHAWDLPWQVPVTNGGSMEFISSNQAFSYFQILGLAKYLSRDPSVLMCPTDKARHPATNYSELRNENISYFLNLDATTNSRTIFGGDRHLEANGRSVSSGAFLYSTNLTLNWTRELHGKVQNGPIGGLSFADGHVEMVRAKDLNSFFQKQLLATNRLAVP